LAKRTVNSPPCHVLKRRPKGNSEPTRALAMPRSDANPPRNCSCQALVSHRSGRRSAKLFDYLPLHPSPFLLSLAENSACLLHNNFMDSFCGTSQHASRVGLLRACRAYEKSKINKLKKSFIPHPGILAYNHFKISPCFAITSQNRGAKRRKTVSACSVFFGFSPPFFGSGIKNGSARRLTDILDVPHRFR